jgi:segregation and condensation protein A
MSEPTQDKPDYVPEDVPYRVRLTIPSGDAEELFEGPLDLLLHLIEKDELDITKVSLALVTDQYLDYLRQSRRINPDNMAEFLVVAAKLLLIKSRALLPVPPSSSLETEEDVGDELARQLVEYKRLKELAEQLRDREALGLHAYLRVGTTPDLQRELDLSGVTLNDLVTAAREALSLVPDRPSSNVMRPFSITVADRIKHIESLLARKGSFSLQRVLRRAASRAEVIVTFLALLELIKRRRARAEQEKLFGEILVFAVKEAANPPEDTGATPPLPDEDSGAEDAQE